MIVYLLGSLFSKESPCVLHLLDLLRDVFFVKGVCVCFFFYKAPFLARNLLVSYISLGVLKDVIFSYFLKAPF